MDMLSLISTLLSAGLAGWVGFSVARRMKSPARLTTWLLTIAGLLIAPFIGVTTYLVNIDGYGITVNWILFGFMLGLLLRMIMRRLRVAETPGIRTL